MEAFFNELSLYDEDLISYEEISTLLSLFKPLRNEGITGCRISEDAFHKIIDNDNNKNHISLMYSFFRKPFESDAVDQKSDEYLSHSWTCNNTECFGIALAYLMDTATISINRNAWKNNVLDFTIDGTAGIVHNYYDENSIELNHSWIESLKKIELVSTNIVPSDKKISLRDDHGKDILMKFAKKLVNNEYVVSIINSLPFNSNIHEFVKKISSNGQIELVLRWEDEGYGLVVQTTGRNLRETKAIADILREKFDK